MIRRLRTFILITGTTLSVLIVAAFVVSAWWDFGAGVPFGGISVEQGSGAIFLGVDPGTGCMPHQGEVFRLGGWNLWNGGRSIGRAYFVRIPLYAVFAAVAVPTLLAWRFGPKPVKPGHCRCGYDLTGNESGTCPECGVDSPIRR